MFASLKLCLYFGHSAAPVPYNDVASLVLYGPLEAGRSECEWLALSPKFNVKRHRWHENSSVFHVGGVLFVAFVSEAFFGLKNASK